uniref:Helicase ATP-binding domain-containing protein n=1 Tax=viral metagenome TaxID=1070528 RepID=A0A6C0B050_9ZZZZ
MSSCDKYNQYATDVLDPEGNLITIKCFDGDTIYREQKTFSVNSYKNYNSTGYYSWIDKNFKSYSFPSEDFADPEKSFNEICNGVGYSLKQQQKFAGRIFNTNTDINSMLVYHGLGSGKTQTSIVIGEAFKDRTVKGKPISGRSDSHVFIVVPAALEKQYYAEIIGKIEAGTIKAASGQIVIEGERQYYGSELVRKQLLKYNELISELQAQKLKLMNEGGNPFVINDIQSKIDDYVGKTKRIIEDQESKVTTVYEIFSHETFLNRLFKIDPNGKFVPQFRDPQGGRLDALRNKNGLLIIDEIQNLVSATGTNYRRLLYALVYYASPSYRTVFLTGTPIYDKPYEFGLLMNLLRTRIPFPDGRDAFNDVFLENETSFINQEYFKKMCSGYISYFKGGNPIAYPYKKTTIMYHQQSGFQYDQYCDALEDEVKKDLPSSRDDDYFVSVTKEDNKTSSGVFNSSNQIANIAFPEYRGTKHMKTVLDGSIAQFKVDISAKLNDLLKRNTGFVIGEIDSLTEQMLDFINYFSIKFSKVAEMIIKSRGPIFVFSNYVTYGVNAMATIMNYLGYTDLHSKEVPGLRGKYFVWNGEANSKHPLHVEEAYKLFNSPENVDGAKLKIMFGTQTVMEGVDFKNIDQIHILDPWWNDSRLQQIMARGIRLCSHKMLPPERRIVNVFIHLAGMGSYEKIFEVFVKDSKGTPRKIITDMQVVNKGARPEDILIRESYVTKPDKEGNVEIKGSDKTFALSQVVITEGASVGDILHKDILVSGDRALIKAFGGYNHKNLASISVQQYMYNRSQAKLYVNRQFEKAVKEVAFDCTINKNGNLVRLDELYIPNKYYDGLWDLYYENYTTGERFVRLGVSSKYPEKYKKRFNNDIQPNLFLLEDILENTALNSGKYTFQSKTQTIKTNDSLILPENINCQITDYTFRFPKKLVDLTINKQMLPLLVKMMDRDRPLLFSILLGIINKTGPLQFADPNLSKNLRDFLLKKSQKRKKIIDELKESGFENNTDWDSLGIKELENAWKFLIKEN